MHSPCSKQLLLLLEANLPFPFEKIAKNWLVDILPLYGYYQNYMN